MAEVDEGLIESLVALSNLLEPARGGLENVALVAVRSVPGCDHASISLLGDDGVVTTAGVSDDRSLRLDELQYEADEGPCLQAIRTGTSVRVDEFARDGRFPAFAAAAAAGGVSSCLSMPVTVAGKTAGGVNLYGDLVRAYSEDSVRAGEEVAGQVAVVIAGSRAFERSLKLVDQFRIAIGSRSEIEQAKGILMARSHCDADQAFDILRRASQRQNVKLRDIAHNIVVRTAAGTTGTPPEESL